MKKTLLMTAMLLCSAMTTWAEEVSVNPTQDVFFRTNSTNTGWNNTTYPMTAETCGDGTFAGNVRVGMFVLQKYTVENLQSATSIKLLISGRQGPDALAIWTFTNDWSASKDASNASTLAAAVQEKIGLALQSTGEPTGTPLINGTNTKQAVGDDRICTFAFGADAIAAIKAAASYEGTTGTFTLLITNKTNEMSNTSSGDRKFYCSANSDEQFRPTLKAEVTTTGISSIEAQKAVKSGEVFNLAGQRVAQPTKGLYIVGGKKVMMK